MKPHPKRRKTIKWGKYGGAAVTVLLVVVWAGTWRWGIMWSQDFHSTVRIARGEVRIEPFDSEGFFIPDFEQHVNWYPTGPVRFSTGGRGMVLWPWTLAVASVTAAAWRLDALARRHERRARLNLCPKCSYDRTGLAKDAVCPECGAFP